MLVAQVPALEGYTGPMASAVCGLTLPFLFALVKVCLAIVIFIQQTFTGHKRSTELGFEDRDSNNSNPGIEFTLCQDCS